LEDDGVTHFEFLGARFDDFADGAALQHFANLERRHIRLPVIHAPAHIRIHRHKQIANQHLLIGQRFQFSSAPRVKLAAVGIPCGREASRISRLVNDCS
jgi:hypothetical protein